MMSKKHEDFNIKTLKTIYRTIKRIEGTDKDFVAIITNRSTLDNLDWQNPRLKHNVKEYPAQTIEEIILASILAEKEGAKGIICGPIAATIVQKMVSIPLSSISMSETNIKDAIKSLITKI